MHAPLLLAQVWQIVTHNWALSSVVAALLLGLALFLLVIGRYVRIAVNIMQESPLPLAMKVRDFRPIPGDDVTFWASDGLCLRGTLCLRPNTHQPPRGMILFAPEYKNDRESCARYCRPRWEAGYDLFTFDFRNHGHSAEEPGYAPRQWASDRECADMTGAMAWLEDWLRREGRPVAYGLFGISRGGCAGILAASQRSAVRAIVVDGAFSADRILEHYLRRYAEIFARVEVVYRNHPPEFWSLMRWIILRRCERRFGCSFPSVQRAIGRMIPRPMLFIHGGRDSYIPELQSRLLYAVAPQPRYLWIVSGARHNQSVVTQPGEYARRTIAFFDEYLGVRAAHAADPAAAAGGAVAAPPLPEPVTADPQTAPAR